MRKTGIVAAFLLAAWTVSACADGAAAGPSPATPGSASATTESATGDDIAAGLMEHHRFHHHGGVTMFIALSIDTLGVSPEQKAAVEKIKADLDSKMEPAHAAERALVSTLADGVASGAFDAAKVNEGIAQVSAASAALHDASADALNQLHATLTPEQRTALVEKVQAHWAVWQKSNHDEAAAAVGRDEGHLATLASDLALTPEQVGTIKTNLAASATSRPPFDPKEVDTQVRAFGDAFRAPTFDAKTLTAQGAASSRLSGWGAAHTAQVIEAITPVLSPEQRSVLAERLREHTTHPHAGGTGAKS